MWFKVQERRAQRIKEPFHPPGSGCHKKGKFQNRHTRMMAGALSKSPLLALSTNPGTTGTCKLLAKL